MITNEQIKKLRGFEDFRCWLDTIHEMREAAIASLESSPTDNVHQKVGAIVAYQAILDNAGYGELLQREKQVL